MRKIYLLFCSFAVLFIIGGCDLENPQNMSTLHKGIVIRLSCTDIQTKGTEAGTGRENYVGTLDVLVYQDAEAASPLMHFEKADLVLNGDYYEKTLGLADFGNDPDEVKSAVIFAVANYPSTLPTDQPLATVKELVLDETTTPTFLAENPYFVMTAEGSFAKGTGTEDDKTVAELPLKRLAAKISLELSFSNQPIQTYGTDNWFGSSTATTTTTTWEPMTNGRNVRCFLVNARTNAVLGGASETPSYPSSLSLFSYDEEILNGEGENTGFKPFYTYPLALENLHGSGDEPYIKLILPWRYTTTMPQGGHDVVINQNIVELYYKIYLPTNITSLNANTFYKLGATLSVLGGEANNPVVIFADGLSILDWNTLGDDELSTIAYAGSHFIFIPNDGRRIKTVGTDKYEVDVDKGESLDISFLATEEVEMTIKKIYFTKLTVGDSSAPSADDGSVEVVIVENDAIKNSSFGTGITRESWREEGNALYAKDWVTMENNSQKKGGTLTLAHQLSVDVDDDCFAITPYHYNVELSLSGHPSIKAEVEIIQKPKMLFKQQLSSGSNGHVFVNGISNMPEQDNGNPRVYYKMKGVYANNNVYMYNGNPLVYPKDTDGASNNSSNNYTKNPPKSSPATDAYYMGKLLGLLSNPTRAMTSHVASKYRYLVEVAPYDAKVYVTNPLEQIGTSSVLGMIFTKSSLQGGTATLPITTYNASGTAYIGNNTSSCIVRTNGTDESQRQSTSYVAGINYKAPALAKVDGENDMARQFIAPRFIIASGYGASANVLDFGEAVLRCATYQEDGYPAGRWRLPTEKEIEYLYRLAMEDYLPSLFFGDYWASSGRLFDYTEPTSSTPASYVFKGNTSQAGAARCVYDAWYWGDEQVAGVSGTYTIKTTKD